MINKVTPRTRNSETDSRFVGPEQYTDAVNVRVGNSFSEFASGSPTPSSNVGVIKPVNGNIEVSTSVSGLRIVGKIVDHRNNIPYFAAVGESDASKNGLYRIKNDYLEAVVTSSYFAWDGVSNVDMTMTYKSIDKATGFVDDDTDPIIYMTDNKNEPFKVDVRFHLENTGVNGSRLYTAITVCTPTPQEPPQVVFGFTPGQSSDSNFKNLPGLQFAYQNIYETGEVSPLSAYSSLAVPPAYLTQGSGDLRQLNNYNVAQVVIPAQPSSVDKIRVLVRFGDEGSWLVIDEIDSDFTSSTVVDFKNDEVLALLPSQQASRQFESVPQMAATNEIVEDRLFYGNYVEGYNNTPVSASMSVVYKERPNDFVALDLVATSEVVVLGRDGDTGTPNRVASVKLELTNPDEEAVPAGSTVIFDITFAPDKNLHLYESSHSFHPNNEIYDFNAGNTSEPNVNYNETVLAPSADGAARWLKATYGWGGLAPAIGFNNNSTTYARVGVSDDVINGNSAKWEVAMGPLDGAEVDAVYGTSPANPLIFKGGELSFSCKFETTTDLTATNILVLVKQVLNGNTSMTLPNDNPDVTPIPVANLLSHNAESTYSYDLGLPSESFVPRDSNIADLICHVADREKILNRDVNSFAVDISEAPIGFFVVNKADLSFRLIDVTDNVEMVSLSDDECYLAVDITSVNSYDVMTCVPVFNTGTSDATSFFSLEIPANEVLYEGHSIQQSAASSLFYLNRRSTINGWAVIDSNNIGNTALLTSPSNSSLFQRIGGGSSQSAYQQLWAHPTNTAVVAAVIDAGSAPLLEVRCKWFGRLKPANTTTVVVTSGFGEDEGAGGVGGGVTTTIQLGDIFIPHSRAVEMSIDAGYLGANADPRDPSSFSNYACSLIDGEGGIGGSRSSLVDTAIAIAPFAVEANSANWDGTIISGPQEFTDAQIISSMAGYSGKIDGSVPSSVIWAGKLTSSIRRIRDNRDATSPNPYYPADVDVTGPDLVGLITPFQYLYARGIEYVGTNGIDVNSTTHLGTTTILGELNEAIVASYSLLNDTSNGYETPFRGYLKINYEDSGFDEQPSSFEILSNNTSILSSADDAQGFRSFKRYAKHDLGVVYYDRFGRSSNVNPLPSVYVSGYSSAETNGPFQGGTEIAVNIVSSPPAWAHKYRFVYAGNSTIKDFVQYTAGGAFTAVQEGEEIDSGNIYVSLNYLQENADVSFAKAFGAVSSIGDKNIYKFAPGDKLRILSYFTAESLDSRVFPYNYVFDVVDVVTLTGSADNPLHDINDGDVPNYKKGQFVVLRNNPQANGFTYVAVRDSVDQAESTSHYWNNRTVVEIFSPLAEKETEERVYKEVGRSYDVILNDNGELVHEYASHIIRDGDVWFRRTAMNIPRYNIGLGLFRNIIRPENASSPRFQDYYVESYRFTDSFANSGSTGRGKTKLYLPDSQRVRKSSSITFSDLNNPTSKYNKFSTFDATTANFKNIPNEHGSIDVMYKDNDSLFVFQKNKLSFLPINRSVLSDASNNASLIASSKVVGTQVFVPGGYGTGGNPESVLGVDGYFYFANRHRREVYRYRPGGGVEIISNMGMKDYFNELLGQVGATGKIITGFDYLNDEFLISAVSSTANGYVATTFDIPSQGSGNQGAEGGTEDIVFEDPGTVVLGVSEEDYNDLLLENEELENQIDELQDEIDGLQGDLEDALTDSTNLTLIAELQTQRNILAEQIKYAVHNVGQSFAPHVENFEFSNPMLQAIYSGGIEQSPEQIISIIALQEGNPNTLEVVDIQTDAPDLSPVIQNVKDVTEALTVQGIKDNITSIGLDVAIDELIEASLDLVIAGGGGDIEATEEDGLLFFDNIGPQAVVNVIVGDVTPGGDISTLPQKISALANVMVSEQTVREGRLSVKSKLTLMAEVFKELEKILVGNLTSNSYTYIDQQERVDIEGTLPGDQQSTGFLGTSSPVSDTLSNYTDLSEGLQNIYYNLANTTPGSIFGEAVVKGPFGADFDVAVANTFVQDVSYIVKRLTDFQYALGNGIPFDPMQFRDQSQATLGVSGMTAEKLLSLTESIEFDNPLLPTDPTLPTTFTAIHGLQILIQSLIDKIQAGGYSSVGTLPSDLFNTATDYDIVREIEENNGQFGGIDINVL